MQYLRSLSATRDRLATAGDPAETFIVVVDADSLPGIDVAAIESLHHPRTNAPTRIAIVASEGARRLKGLCERRSEFTFVPKCLQVWDIVQKVVEPSGCGQPGETETGFAPHSSTPPSTVDTVSPTDSPAGRTTSPPSGKLVSRRQASYRMYGKVLSVDDDPDVTRFLQMRLQLHGLDVMRAGDGIQGFRLAVEWKPDVIITDFSMPEGLGSYLLGRMRDCGIEIPTIVLSGVVQDERSGIGMQFRDLGAHAVLSKPVDWAKLIGTIREVIHLPEVEEDAACPHIRSDPPVGSRNMMTELDDDTLMGMYYPTASRSRVRLNNPT